MNISDNLETLTFYRKMANSNPIIMKNYKSASINKMSRKQIFDIYIEHNIKLDQDVNRLKKFKKPNNYGLTDFKYLSKTKYFRIFLPLINPYFM